MAHVPDNNSCRMIQLCGDKITLSLGIIFVNIINTGIFPTLWKSGNVTMSQCLKMKESSCLL